MQNWNTMQAPVNYEQHANWYNNMYNGPTGIKTEPGTVSPPTGMTSPLETYLKQHAQQQQQHQHQLPPRETISMMTPSPSNNDSMQQHYFEGNMQQQFLQHQQYQQQFQQAQQAAAHNQVTAAQLSLGFKPLTPPGLPAAMLPSMTNYFPANSQANLQMNPKTPSTKVNVQTPASETTEKIQTVITPRNTPPMDITPPKSPQPTPRKCKKPNDDDEACINNNPTTNTNSNSQRNSKLLAKDDDNSDTDDGQSESGVVISNVEQLRSMYGEEIIDWDQIQDDITRPIINSHGKMKKFSCRTCNFTAFTKLEFWLHSRTHMKSEKILKCPLCPFVTELKHHLEYHICKHENVKPFQCHLCAYSCVNKSMLASHLKSHSPVYQYNCGDCDYFTKYCHSFKLHLRKMQHKQGVILNEEGQPDPSIVIDVYGTRRGPKSKTTKRTRNDSQSSGTNGATTTPDVPTQSLSSHLQNYSITQQLPPSPARSNSSDMSPVAIAQQQQQQQSKEQAIDASNILIPIQKQCEHALPGVLSNLLTSEQTQQPISNLLAPLASLLQNNHNISLLPYLNLNLQMLAAQQQAVAYTQEMDKEDAQSTHEDADDQDEHIDDSSYDSAMDLTQNSPIRIIKKESMEEVALNLKLQEESNDSTPLASSNNASRRKGRALQLDTLLHSKLVTDASNQIIEQTSSIDMTVSATSKDESADKQSANNEQSNDGLNSNTNNNTSANNSDNTNSSTSNLSEKTSSVSSNSNGSKITQETPSLPAGLYECKYCEMYYKNAVIHTIHMGYHSCDDVFKCNMCGVKCDGPVDFFVHIARTAHS